MKKIILIFLAVVTAVSFNACNNGGDDKKAEEINTDSTNAENTVEKKIVDECPGDWNITLDENEAKKMRAHYMNTFKKTNTYLTDSAWIDNLVIRSLAAFFESPGGRDFDGVRFVNGAPSGNNKSIVMIVPTKAVPDTNLHTEIWGNDIFSLLEGTPVSFQHYNLKYKEYAEERINRFETLYRKGGATDSLSTKVWMHKCVFSELKKLMEIETTDKITGVSVLFGAYKNKAYRIPGQKYDTQSTIIIVPTSSDGVDGHTNRWDIVKSKLIRKQDAGYNHGELCPTKCN